MSWLAILTLAAATYAMKAVGPVAIGRRPLPPRVVQTLELLSIPLLAALTAVQTLSRGGELVLDARIPAMTVAALLVWRRAPFLVIVLAAAGTAALIRAL